MALTNPTRNPDVLEEDLGDEIVLSTADGLFVHNLNPTAAAIWRLCDGAHSAEQIEAAIRAEFNVPEEMDISADINHTLDTFRAKQLLQ